MNDSAIRLIGEVFLFWGVGVGDVLMLLVWRWRWRRYDLYFLVVLVCVVRWMRGGGVDVLSLVAFVSGQSLVWWAQSSP